MGYKAGTNFSDRVAIEKMAAEGLSAEEISTGLFIELPVVEDYLDHLENKDNVADDDSDDEDEE